jgi:hypothetical protein
VFLKADIAAILHALAMTAQAIPPGEWQRGYQAAIAAVAVALGIRSIPPTDDALRHT